MRHGNRRALLVAAAALAALAACSSKGDKGGGPQSGACLSDKDCRAQGKLCDPATAACVQCLVPADCGMSADCVAGACVAFESCKTSLECKTDEVCDTARGRCVGCLADTDCGEMSHCVANTCRASCQSDKDCVSKRQLCDFASSTCVDCLRNTDCPAGKHCSTGTCADQVCTPASTSCTANMLFTCSENGIAWQSPITCPMECRMTGDGGVCSERSDGGAGGGGGTDGSAALDSPISQPDAGARPDVPVANGPCGDLIDNMETGDGRICHGNGRMGQWYTAGNTSVMPDQTLHPIPAAAGGYNGSAYAIRMSTPLYGGTGAILGVDLQYDGTTVYGHYDASAYSGLSFMARGIGLQDFGVDVWVSCASTTPIQYGGTCGAGAGCYANTTRVFIGTEWMPVTISFAQLTGGYAPFNRAELTYLQFRVAGYPTGAVELWIDDLTLVR